jgi:hypothetical protein
LAIPSKHQGPFFFVVFGNPSIQWNGSQAGELCEVYEVGESKWFGQAYTFEKADARQQQTALFHRFGCRIEKIKAPFSSSLHKHYRLGGSSKIERFWL